MGKNLYWVGPRESDIRHTGELFSGSITLYGSGSGRNRDFCSFAEKRINHNIITEEQLNFVYNEQIETLKQDPEARFISYHPMLVYAIPAFKKIIDYTECLNGEQLLNKLDNKKEFKDMASQTVEVLQSRILKGEQCNYESLSRMSSSPKKAFIVQAIVGASGGWDTYFLDSQNGDDIKDIDDRSEYLVSEYIESNVPVNVHVLIFDKEVVVLPPSIQLIHQHNGRLLYFGADYIAYREIDREIHWRFREESRKLCYVLQAEGYRGVLGLDAIIVGNSILFLEINPRFQGSSADLNSALWECGYPSIQELNLQAFSSDFPTPGKDKLENLLVNFSSFAHAGTHKAHIENLYRQSINESTAADFIGDGYDHHQLAEDDAHQFTIQFRRNISSPYHGNLRIHQNLIEPSEEWESSIAENTSKSKLKISLINQGVRISALAKLALAWNGGMRKGVYHSLDIDIAGDKYNAPLETKLAALSPFEIDCQDDAFVLHYYGKIIARVSIDTPHRYLTKTSRLGIPFERIFFLATDRMRIQNNSFCTFVEQNTKCRFCEAIHYPIQFDVDDILDAIDSVFSLKTIPFRHIMIGGLSNHIGQEREPILKICQKIREFTNLPIYLMCLPPEDVSDIDAYIDAGISEIGFNLEVYDRNIARTVMPGKGRISMEQYDEAFKHALVRLNGIGHVYSAFVVGLEPATSLLEGIEYVCSLGVRPILSPFLALPKTPFQDIISLENAEIGSIYEEAMHITNKFGVALGPDCPECRNNTL